MASHITAFVVGVPSLQLDRLAFPLSASAALTPSSQNCHGCRTKAIPDGDLQRSVGKAVSSIILRGGLGALSAISWRRWSTGRHHLTTARRATLRKRRYEHDDFDEIVSAEDAFTSPYAKKKKSGKQTQRQTGARALNDNEIIASKAKLKEICKVHAAGRMMTDEQNAEIESIVMSFELTPSAKSPAKSSLADGEWNVIYCAGKGDGIGVLAGESKQTVDALNVKLTDTVTTLLGTFSRNSIWSVTSANTLRLTRKAGWSPVAFGVALQFFTFEEASIEMTLSVQVLYLDKNFRIWRMEGMQDGKFAKRLAIFERI